MKILTAATHITPIEILLFGLTAFSDFLSDMRLCGEHSHQKCSIALRYSDNFTREKMDYVFGCELVSGRHAKQAHESMEKL